MGLLGAGLSTAKVKFLVTDALWRSVAFTTTVYTSFIPPPGFFTSHVFDEFRIDSKRVSFRHDEQFAFEYILETDFSNNKSGTAVYMFVTQDSARDIQTVFYDYAWPDEFQFNKTVIPVRLARYENEKLVSRSKAKKL